MYMYMYLPHSAPDQSDEVNIPHTLLVTVHIHVHAQLHEHVFVVVKHTFIVQDLQ